MAHIGGEIIIQRPVEQVFDFVADERNEPRYDRRMVRAEKVSPGGIGQGARFGAELEAMGRTNHDHRRRAELRTDRRRDPGAVVVGHPAAWPAQAAVPARRLACTPPGAGEIWGNLARLLERGDVV